MSDKIKRLIETGDRADLKNWLANCSDDELVLNWTKLVTSRIQDFDELTYDTMKKRGIVRERK